MDITVPGYNCRERELADNIVASECCYSRVAGLSLSLSLSFFLSLFLSLSVSLSLSLSTPEDKSVRGRKVVGKGKFSEKKERRQQFCGSA
jgi:hypothetical protein